MCHTEFCVKSLPLVDGDRTFDVNSAGVAVDVQVMAETQQVSVRDELWFPTDHPLPLAPRYARCLGGVRERWTLYSTH